MWAQFKANRYSSLLGNSWFGWLALSEPLLQETLNHALCDSCSLSMSLVSFATQRNLYTVTHTGNEMFTASIFSSLPLSICNVRMYTQTGESLNWITTFKIKYSLPYINRVSVKKRVTFQALSSTTNASIALLTVWGRNRKTLQQMKVDSPYAAVQCYLHSVSRATSGTNSRIYFRWPFLHPHQSHS